MVGIEPTSTARLAYKCFYYVNSLAHTHTRFICNFNGKDHSLFIFYVCKMKGSRVHLVLCRPNMATIRFSKTCYKHGSRLVDSMISHVFTFAEKISETTRDRPLLMHLSYLGSFEKLYQNTLSFVA